MLRKPLLMLISVLLTSLGVSQTTYSQVETTSTDTTSAAQEAQRTRVIEPALREAGRVAGKSNLFCAGYIKYQKFGPMPEIVGAEDEPNQRTFADGDIVFLDWGSSQGIKVGQRFQIIRPKGDVKGVFREKKGFLGTYVRELG